MTRRGTGLADSTRLALGLFGLGAGPAFFAAGDAGVALLGGGVALSWAATSAADAVRLLCRRIGPRSERRAAMALPSLRVALGLAALFGVARLGVVDIDALTLVVALTYPAFLLQAAVHLAQDATLWARQEARLA